MQGRACASVSAEYEAPARDARTAETMWRCRCASLTSESVGGVFGTACGVGGALGGAGTHCSRGRRSFGAVGCPQGFYCGFFVQSPGRSRIAARLVRGEGEACVS